MDCSKCWPLLVHTNNLVVENLSINKICLVFKEILIKKWLPLFLFECAISKNVCVLKCTNTFLSFFK